MRGPKERIPHLPIAGVEDAHIVVLGAADDVPRVRGVRRADLDRSLVLKPAQGRRERTLTNTTTMSGKGKGHLMRPIQNLPSHHDPHETHTGPEMADAPRDGVDDLEVIRVDDQEQVRRGGDQDVLAIGAELQAPPPGLRTYLRGLAGGDQRYESVVSTPYVAPIHLINEECSEHHLRPNYGISVTPEIIPSTKKRASSDRTNRQVRPRAGCDAFEKTTKTRI
jgi:hypothetical protein